MKNRPIKFLFLSVYLTVMLVNIPSVSASSSVKVAAAGTGRTFYVDPAGNDNNDGSLPKPWKTIQKFGDVAAAGDTLVVRAGTYAGAVFGWDGPNQGTYSQISGTANQPITITADPQAPAGSVIINKGNSKTHVALDLEPGCDYVMINGFVIDGAGGIANYPDKGSGIKATGNNDVIINNVVKNIDYGFGITSDGANHIRIENNEVMATGWHNNGNYGHGIYVAGGTDAAIVKGNRLHDNSYTGLQFNGDPDVITNAIITDNQIYNNGGQGINADGLQNSVIADNLFDGYQNFGISLFQGDSSGPSFNNTLVNNTFAAPQSGAGAAIRILNAATGNIVFNNILLGGADRAYRISSDSLTGFISDYNVVGNLFQSEDSGQDQTLAQWRAQTGQDNHSLVSTSNQLFVAAANNDFHLSNSSPARDKGISTLGGQQAPMTDIDNKARPAGSGFDIGAFEFGAITNGNDTAPPVVTLLSPAINSTVQGSVQISANASDNIGVTRVEFWLDNTLLGTDVQIPYTLVWQTQNEADGPHTIVLKAFDAANNVGTTQPIVVTVSNSDGVNGKPQGSPSSPKDQTLINSEKGLIATFYGAGFMTVMIYDQVGKKRATLSGTTSITYDGKELASGTYRCYVEEHGNKRSEKLVVVH